MKYFLILLMGLSLTSCATPQTQDVIVTKLEVVIPPLSILRCGDVKIPNKFISNKEVALSYIKLWKHNHYCHNNMESVKKYLDDAQKDVTPDK
jgi:hypothetical protein